MKALFGCGVLGVIVCATALAQEQQTPPAGTLSALTTEIRLLRIAVEKSAQSQTQIQGLSVYLSAQQSRLMQASARLDTVRKDLDTASRDARVITDRIATARAALDMSVSAEERTQLQEMLKMSAREATRATEYEAQIRGREAEALAELQTELTRWNELMTRLEQAIRQ